MLRALQYFKFQNKQRQKRSAKGKRSGGESTEAKGEIIVQRMSSEVTGKQQKYSRFGPWQFVPFEFDENLATDYVCRHMKST